MKKAGIEIVVTVIFVILYITGCASQKETMIEQGYPPAYADGYQDGCSSGNNAAGSMLDQFKKNVQLYKENNDYHQGWDDGYKQCKAKQAAFQEEYRTSVEQQRLIEEKRHNKKIEERKLLEGIDTSGLENLK